MPSFPEHLNESVSASPEYSPGVVLDSETLLREMFDPQHVIDGNVVVTAVSLTELRSTGFSVHRKDHVSLEVVKNATGERLQRPRKGEPWKDEGVAEILTAEARSFSNDGERLFAVIDTALSSNRGHASIFARHPELGDAHARKLRSILLPLLQDRKPVEQIFEEIGYEQNMEKGNLGGMGSKFVRVFMASGLSKILYHMAHTAISCWRACQDKGHSKRGDS